jgi:hypothetical protein
MFKEIIAVSTENHMKQVMQNALLIVKSGEIYSYHWVFDGFILFIKLQKSSGELFM